MAYKYGFSILTCYSIIRSNQEAIDSDDASNPNQVLLSHWLQRQLSSERTITNNSTEQSNILPSDIVLNIDNEGTSDDNEGSTDESVRHEATLPQPSVNNQNNPFTVINDILEQNPEVYSLLRSFLRYLPFVILVLLKEIYEHTTGIHL